MSFTRRLLNRTPVPFTDRVRTVLPFGGRNDTTAQMDAYGSVGTLHAIVNRNMTATASVEWRLYRKSDGRGRIAGEEDRREVTQHLALDVWNKPNKFFTRNLFVQSIIQHRDLVGEQWWLVVRSDGFSAPLELWPIRPDRIEPVPSPTEFISGYLYCGPSGEKIPLGLDEVICVKLPNPKDPYRGMGPVQTILTDLDSERYSAEWNRMFFENSAEPGGIIEVDKRLTDDEFKELGTRWNEQHRGVSNAHRVAVLEQGEWKATGYTQRDMQFVELRKVSREIIREAMGFPKPMLGATDDVNRANAEAAEYLYAKYLTVPRLDEIKTALNESFLPMFGTSGQGLEFDYVNPVPEDKVAESAERTSKVAAATNLVNTGYDPAQSLEVVGLPPIEFIGKQSEPESADQGRRAPMPDEDLEPELEPA